MNGTLRVVTVLVGTLAVSVAAAQGPAAGRQSGTGERERDGRALSNEASGVDIDRFIGDPAESPAHLANGGLLTHAILRPGNPYEPGQSRAVLEYRNALATAVLPPRNRTPLVSLDDHYFFYVTGGTGQLDDGAEYWDLRENMAILIPPSVERRFTNTSDTPLTMVMLAWTPVAGTSRADILVRDVDALQYCEENVHWNNMSKCIFRTTDGLLQRERMYLVMLEPWAMSEPHVHNEGTEEIWVKLSPGTAITLLGSELREVAQYSAYLAPPTGVTQHANLNLDHSRRASFLYIARGRVTSDAAAQPPVPARPVSAPPREDSNPNLFGNQATAELANVAGKPLP